MLNVPWWGHPWLAIVAAGIAAIVGALVLSEWLGARLKRKEADSGVSRVLGLVELDEHHGRRDDEPVDAVEAVEQRERAADPAPDAERLVPRYELPPAGHLPTGFDQALPAAAVETLRRGEELLTEKSSAPVKASPRKRKRSRKGSASTYRQPTKKRRRR